MSEQWTDDEIIGAILAGGQRRPIVPSLGSFGQTSSVRNSRLCFENMPSRELPCCAVGAGILFRGLRIADEQAIAVFANEYGVTAALAQGVSDGFEDSPWWRYLDVPDYARGWAIGAAVRSALRKPVVGGGDDA